MDVDATQLEIEPVLPRVANTNYDSNNELDIRGDEHVDSDEKEDDSDVSSYSPGKYMLGPKSLKILHALDKRVFAAVVPKAKPRCKAMRPQTIPQAKPDNRSDVESPGGDEYDGDNDDDGVNDKDGDSDNESQSAPQRPENGDNDNDNEIESDRYGYDNVEDRKRKRYVHRALNNLQNRSQALKQKFGRDLLASATRKAESINRTQRIARSIDRYSSTARDASLIVDSSPITRRARSANVERTGV